MLDFFSSPKLAVVVIGPLLLYLLLGGGKSGTVLKPRPT
jgi:hypothetical protein